MISVIIPVYNASKYLYTCIKSIQQQTYSDLQIIVVDDGSTDNSLSILQELAANDSRICVIHQENQGVSVARNTGIECATGQYITFVDSDDTIDRNMYAFLFDLIKQHHADIAHCSYNRIIGNKVIPIGNTGSIYVQSPEETLACFAKGRLYIASCWNKLYARHLFDNIRFCSDFKVSEDFLVNFQVFSKANKAVFADVCKYNYLTSETSACKNTPSLKQAQDHLAVARIVFSENKYPSLQKDLKQRVLNALVSYYRALLYAENHNLTELQKCSSEINGICAEGYSLSCKSRIMYYMMRHFPNCFKYLYKIYDTIRVPNHDVER